MSRTKDHRHVIFPQDPPQWGGLTRFSPRSRWCTMGQLPSTRCPVMSHAVPLSGLTEPMREWAESQVINGFRLCWTPMVRLVQPSISACCPRRTIRCHSVADSEFSEPGWPAGKRWLGLIARGLAALSGLASFLDPLPIVHPANHPSSKFLPKGFTVRTGHGDRRTTCSVTLPRSM